MANFNRMKMAQMRDGQNPNMGEQRSQSPNGSGDAPSPNKRQRMEGAFNGQGMPAGRGQGMAVQQANMPGPNGMMLQSGMPDAFNAQQLAKMNVCPHRVPPRHGALADLASQMDAQGSPMAPANGDGKLAPFHLQFRCTGLVFS
ncbi:MAG: hypothetical protein INR71_04125 [Terriglobus roseus]|nr:hypothetical protein [Terriglobus roseus]